MKIAPPSVEGRDLGKAVLIGLALVFGFIVFALASGRSPDAVSDECRDIVIHAAANVDGWRYIQGFCPEEEQQALLREYRARGLSTEALEKSRAN